MGFLQQAGKSISSSKSSGGFLQQAGVSNLAESAKQIPVMQKTGAVSPTTVKKTSSFIQPTKETGPITSTKYKIGNVDFGRLGKSIKSGTELVPSQLKTAGGIILSSVARQAEKANEFFGKVETAQNIIRPRFIEEATAQARARKKLGHQMLELKGTQLREVGAKESEKKLKEISGRMAPSKGLQSYLEMASFNLPQMATSTALTIATGIVTRNPILASTVGLSTSYGLGASEVYSEARRSGLKDAEAMPLAQAGGALIGAIDFLPLGRLLTKTGAIKPIQKSITKKIAQGVVSLGVQSGFEGITEGLQEVIGNAIKSTYKENQNLFEGVKESVVVGALLGGITDVTVAGVTGSIENKATPEQVVDHVNKQVEKALNTPPEKRTQEQEAVVRTMSERVVSPDEAITMVIDMGIEKSEVGKKLVLASLEAKQANKDVRVTQNRSAREINIEVVSADQSTPPLSPTAETPDRGVAEQGSAKPTIAEAPKSVVKAEDLLIQEARKYKSAEDFVKAQGQPLYHGTNADFKVFDKTKIGSATDEGLFGKGFYFGNSESFARVAPKGRLAKNVMEVYPSTDANIFDIAKVKSKTEMANLLNMSEDALIQDDNGIIRPIRGQVEQFTSHLQELGYDGVVVKRGADAVETVIFEPSKISTKSQLTDIYNQAMKSEIKPKKKIVTAPQEQLPVGEGKKKASRLEARIKGITGDLSKVDKNTIDEKNLSTFEQVNEKENISKAVEYLDDNQADALEVLKGNKEAPKGILRNALFVAMERASVKDVDLARKFASLSSTRYGQEIAILRNIDRNSPGIIMSEVVDVRRRAVDKRYPGKKPKEIINSQVQDIKRGVKKPDKYDWNTFISSLEC